MTTTQTYASFKQVALDINTGAYSQLDNGFGNYQNTIGDDPSDNSPGDGSAGDGVETAGEELYWTTASDVVTFTGYHIDGEPIVEYLGFYYLLTNNFANIGPGTATAGNYFYCFARGTHIATPGGERQVQDLAIGDTVLDHQGRPVAVKWIGRQAHTPLMARLQGQLPVRIEAGALGSGLPHRDLFVTPDHALLVDGVLVHALALVNDRSIVQVAQWSGDLEYFHVETEAHEIILAEGAPAETFIDNVDRAKFDNHAEYLALYPDAQPMVELGLPRVKFARQLPMAIKRRLEAVAQVSAPARAA